MITNQTDFGFNLKADFGCYIGNRHLDTRVEADDQLEAGGDKRCQGSGLRG